MFNSIVYNKLKTATKLASYMPISLGYYQNFAKAIIYNVLPPKYKNPKLKFCPLSVTIYLNTICNYRCSFCFLITEDHIGTKKKNIDMEQFLKIIDHPKNKFATRFTLGGGEPFLNKEIFNFITELRKRKKLISVYTNGSLISRQFEKFRDNPTDYLNISHYDDKFPSIIDSLQKLQNMKNKPIIRLSKIISTENIDDMEKMVRLAKKYKIESVIFQNFFTTEDNEQHKIIYDDNKIFMKEKKKVRKYHKDIEILWPNVMQRQAVFNCQNISLNATYDADGDLSPCCFIVPPEEKFGNLFTNGDPWNSEAMISFRKAYRKEKKEHSSCQYCYFRQGLKGRYR